MALWFRKKEQKPESTPQTIKQEQTTAKPAESASVEPEPEEHLPIEPIVPVARPVGLRSFKLPPASGGTSDTPAAVTDSAVSQSPTPTLTPVSPAPAPAIPAPAPVSPAPVATSPAPAPVAPAPAPTIHVKTQVPSQTASRSGGPVSLENMPPGVKPILKPILSKSRIQVADKSDVPIPKTEPVAADMPAVSRTDPKALYYLLMNGLYDVVFVLDDDGHVMDCNTRAEEIFGYSPDDVWNIPIEKIVYGMNSRMFSLLKKNLTNKRHILIDARCFRSNGTSFLGEVGVSTVQLTRTQNIVFAIRNVERRKNSADELRKYRAVIDTSPMPSFACDLHGRFEVMNRPVLKALGMVDEMEAQKKHFGEMLPDMIEHFQVAVRGKNVLETKEITRPDGTLCTMELRLTPMRKGEEITGVAGTIIFS